MFLDLPLQISMEKCLLQKSLMGEWNLILIHLPFPNELCLKQGGIYFVHK